MRLTQSLNLVLSKDTTQLLKTYEREQTVADSDTVDSLVNSRSESNRSLAASAQHTVDLVGFPAVKVLFVEATGPLNVTLNGEVIPVRQLSKTTAPNSPKLNGRLLLWTEGITSIVFANPSVSTAVELTWAVAG